MGDYSLAQIELYLEAAEKQGREDMRNSMIAARCAKADAKDFKKIMKGFD